MADGKNSFILYADIINTISQIPDEKAGQLFKFILEYVNDKNPSTDDLLLKVLFEPIKASLKRDLLKWEGKSVKRSIAGSIGGKKSGEARRSKFKQNEAIASIVKQDETNEAVSVSVSVSDSVNDNKKIINSDVPDRDKTDFKIIDYKLSDQSTYEEKVIKQFHSLFCKIATRPGEELKDKTLLKAKMEGWKKDLNLLIVTDKVKREDLLRVYNHLEKSKDRFWANTVSSFGGIRKNFDKIQAKIRVEEQKPPEAPQEVKTGVFSGNIKHVTK